MKASTENKPKISSYRRINICSKFFRRKKELLLIWFLFVIVIFSLIKRMTDLNHLLDVHKCPACYGVSFCPQLAIAYIPLSISSFFFYYINSKNVYFARIKDKPVVLKKLAHDSELDEFDQNLCTKLGLTHPCDFDNLLDRKDLKDRVTDLVSLKDEHSIAPSMLLCPSTDGLETILNPYLDSIFIRSVAYANLFTIMSINPEIILMQYLNKNGHFPIATFLGSCGRIAAFSYEGKSLGYFTSASWMTRAKITQKLLTAIDKFTFLDQRFSFYLTDISLDNIVLNSQSNEIFPIFVDLENVIVVDRLAKDQPQEWKTNHTSEHFHCSDCLLFSPKDICAHKYSDHNHYSLCKMIQEDFLQRVPSYISKIFPNFKKYLDACVSPVPGMDRFKAAKLLNNELLKIVSHF